MARKAKPKTMQGYIDRFRGDPVYFTQRVLGVTPTKQQAQLLRAVAPPDAHVSVKSGHGTGKTMSLACLILWFLSCFRDCKIPCTAPSSGQLMDALWPEVAKWRERMLPTWRDRIEITKKRAYHRDFPDSRFAVPRTARPERPEALQGFHADNLLFIVDEASGVVDQVFVVAEGGMTTKGSRVVLTSNPTRPSGYQHRTQTTERADWTCLTFNAEDSPLVSRKWIRRMAKRYGRDSDMYRIRVLGEYPRGGARNVIPLDLLERAVGNLQAKEFGPRIAGVDVARFGNDDSALIVRHGDVITHIERWHGNDVVQSAGRVMDAWRADVFDEVRVDSIGVGAGVADILRHNAEFPVQDVNVSESSPNPEYYKLRDYLWFSAAEWLADNECRLPAGQEFLEDLLEECCAVEYDYTPNGKRRVESKDDTKERLGRSPDLADAFVMTFSQQSIAGVSKWAKSKQR